MPNTKKVQVRCTFVVEIEVPVDQSDASLEFEIEDNGCPGTGIVGRAVEELMRKHEEQGTCWACASHGSNEIVK